MKVYGDTPPWEKESDFGRWVWVAPDPDSWFDDPGYWELKEPRSNWVQILSHIRIPFMKSGLTNEVFLPRITSSAS